jgi:hypothetical protein
VQVRIYASRQTAANCAKKMRLPIAWEKIPCPPCLVVDGCDFQEICADGMLRSGSIRRDSEAMKKTKLVASDFPEKRIPFHGKYEAHIEGQLILTQAIGPFNDDMAEAYGELVAPLFAQANGVGPFGSLVEFHKSMLASVSTIDLVAEVMALAVKNFPRYSCVAHVSDRGVSGRDMMGILFEQKVFRPIGLPYRMFDNRAAAEQWLSGEIGKMA